MPAGNMKCNGASYIYLCASLIACLGSTAGTEEARLPEQQTHSHSDWHQPGGGAEG